ncbi:MAG: sensor histidine kinase, partial [Solirubrobacteraceae bacterium]
LLLMRALLGPTGRSQRVAHLEAARNVVAEDAAATLRRIERDLHDGTQAQLVALAMNLGAVRERLEDRPTSTDPGTLELVVATHDQTVDALDELRNIVRGIHPPALDLGLADALATLTARSALPTVLRDELRSRPSDAVATIAYYSVAELLTNAAKHSSAESVEVLVTERRGRLAITVTDDGHGGADPARGSGSGLRGLAARLDAIDGSLTVQSPPGGPTAITVDLPLRI